MCPRLILAVISTCFGKSTRGGLGYLCEFQVFGLFILSIFLFYEAVEPDMQDIRWGRNILEDWKLDEKEITIFSSWGKEQVFLFEMWLVGLADGRR